MAASDRNLLHAGLRHDLLGFTIQVFHTVHPGTAYDENWHVEAVTHQLEKCLCREQNRLIITQPPRSLKSICVSVAFVAWALGRDPSLRFICASYSSELATNFARMFRSVVTSSWYRQVFPRLRIARDTEFEVVTTDGGGRLATSVGGTLTGKGGDIIILDDPMKAEDTLSEAARKRVIHWYQNTLFSRLDSKQRGVIILVMQRLHEEDLAGFLLEQGGWTLLDLPAIAMERETIALGHSQFHIRQIGDVLQPREPRKVLERIKQEIGTFNFHAQYQQRPVPLEGNLIRWKWFRVGTSFRQSNQRIVQSWDTALKAGLTHDYSVCTTWRICGTDYYLIDVLRERLEYPELKKKAIWMARRHMAHSVLIEDKGSGTALLQDLQSERKLTRPIPIGPESDKTTRMATQAPTIEAGHVILPEQAPWLDEFKAEVLAFPYGKYDDQIDSMSQFLKWIREAPKVFTKRIIGQY